jgi:predicted mannosyl-3-phosphoglycerate phosphatase (HAD superfamily)
MRFTWEDLKFMFQEIRRVLRKRGFRFLFCKKPHHHDKSYGKGRKIDIDDDVYDLKKKKETTSEGLGKGERIRNA